MRLMGNMLADHKVVFAFFALIPLVVPLPFMLLGLLVCLIQALVFCTLTMVYVDGGEHAETLEIRTFPLYQHPNHVK